MPGTRPHYEDFADMPDGLRHFLFSDEYDAAETDLVNRFSLTDDEASFVSDSLLDAVFAERSLSETLERIRVKLVSQRIPEEKWKIFLTDLLKYHAWPLRDLYGAELTDILSAQGLSTAGWLMTRILLKPLSFSGAASEVATMSGFSLTDQMRDRLKDLLLSKTKGIRSDEQIKEALMRPSESAGLGLDVAMADKTVASMKRVAASVKVLSDSEYETWLAEESRQQVPVPSPVISSSIRSSSELSEDDKEIAAIKARMPTVETPASILDQAIEEIFQGLSGKPEDEYLAKRLRYIISSRLRDVRNTIELKQLLQRDTKVGGVGLARDAAEAMTTGIETGYAKFHSQIMAEEKKSLDVQMTQQKQKIEERKKRDAEDHAKWYQEKVVSRKEEEAKRTKIAADMKRAMVVGPTTITHPIDAREARTETAQFGAMVPAVAAGIAMQTASNVKTAQTMTQGSTQTERSPFAMPSSRVEAHPNVKVSTATVDLQRAAPTVRPRMDDVVSATKLSPSVSPSPSTSPDAVSGSMRLTGPVGELSAISLMEFRRLAKNPEEAAAKVFQKFEVLGQESFERRIEGVKAWMASPLQGAYMKLVSEALGSGKPMIELSREKISAGQTDLPSPEEISAILSLNAKLHY